MKKFNKKMTAFILTIMMLLTFVPSLSFADEPAAPMMILRMDSDYYKKGDDVNAELWVYNANFNTAGFALGFDTTSVQLVDGEDFYESVSFAEYHNGTGIFVLWEQTALADNENGIVKAVFYISPMAKDAPSVVSPTNENAREAVVGSDGYKIADINFTAQKDGTADISFTKIEKDPDFSERAYALGYKGETPHDVELSVEYAETPLADAEKFAETVAEIGDVTLEDENAITEAYEAYENLSDLAKELAENAKAELDAAEEALKALKDAMDEAEKEAAKLKEAKEALEKIAEDDEITIEDADAVKSAKALYDALTDKSKAQIGEELVKALSDAVAKIEELEKDLITLGDVNGDSLVNALDATQILRFANGKSSVLTGVTEGSAVYKAADVNADGLINALDATQILRFANGKSSVLTK